MRSPCHGCPLNGTDKKVHECYSTCKSLESYNRWLEGDRIDVAGTWFECNPGPTPISARRTTKMGEIHAVVKPEVLCSECGDNPIMIAVNKAGREQHYTICRDCWIKRLAKGREVQVGEEKKRAAYRLVIDLDPIIGQDSAAALYGRIEYLAKAERRPFTHQVIVMLERSAQGIGLGEK